METTDKLKRVQNQRRIHPVLGALAAIAITTAVSASGLSSSINALTLAPLFVLLWYLERLSRAEMGFIWGRIRHYGLGLLYPVLVLGLSGLMAWASGAIHLENTDWPATWFKLVVTVVLTILLSIITEEGFFRGWLWSALERAGQRKVWVVVWTSLAFGAWHLPIALIDTGFPVPLAQVPIYIFNVVVAGGLIFGLLRLISGSVIVPSVIHGVWNGFGYVLFGSGATVGALGIQETAIYGPEIGLVGIVLNLGFAIGLGLWYRRASRVAAAKPGLQIVPVAQGRI